MLAKKILRNLENRNYRVEYREHCDCEFYWYEKGIWSADDELGCETIRTYGNCYFNNVLIMDDLASQCDGDIIIGSDGVIASYDTYFGVSLQILCTNPGVEKILLKYIINDPETYCQLIASINYPDAYNKLHEKRKIKSLFEYLDWKKDNN